MHQPSAAATIDRCLECGDGRCDDEVDYCDPCRSALARDDMFDALTHRRPACPECDADGFEEVCPSCLARLGAGA